MSAGVTILGYPTDTTPLDTGLRSSICIPGEIVAAETNTAKQYPGKLRLLPFLVTPDL